MYNHVKKKNFTLIFSYFSKPLKLLYSLIIYEIVNFLSSLFTLCYFFLYLKNVPIHVIVHVHNGTGCPVLRPGNGGLNIFDS